MKLAEALNLRATHENTLVTRRSLGDDEHQGAKVPTVVRDLSRRARCVPDRPGQCRSLADISDLTADLRTGRSAPSRPRPPKQ